MSTQKRRLVLATGVIAFAAAAVGWFAYARSSEAAPSTELRSLIVAEADGFRYEYHVPTGREGLYQVTKDKRRLVNVIDNHKEIAAKCRRSLEQKLGVQDLDSLRVQYEEQIRRLRALGYL